MRCSKVAGRPSVFPSFNSWVASLGSDGVGTLPFTLRQVERDKLADLLRVFGLLSQWVLRAGCCLVLCRLSSASVVRRSHRRACRSLATGCYRLSRNRVTRSRLLCPSLCLKQRIKLSKMNIRSTHGLLTDERCSNIIIAGYVDCSHKRQGTPKKFARRYSRITGVSRGAP